MQSYVQGCPKELVMGCENFHDLCVKIWRNKGRGGAVWCFPSSYISLFPQTVTQEMARNLRDLFPFKIKESQSHPPTASSSYSLSRWSEGERSLEEWGKRAEMAGKRRKEGKCSRRAQRRSPLSFAFAAAPYSKPQHAPPSLCENWSSACLIPLQF